MTLKTSVIGFPRIGKNRELKFASEKYFKGSFNSQSLNYSYFFSPFCDAENNSKKGKL